jgi:hypothetical protein
MARLKKEDLEFMTDEQIREFINNKEISEQLYNVLSKHPNLSLTRVEALLFVIVQERFIKQSRKADLMKFLKYIKEECCDTYGNLEVVEEGDELDPTFERVVNHYITKN